MNAFTAAAILSNRECGIYGDFLYSVNQTRYGSGPVEALAGPTIGPLLEMGLVQPLNAVRAAMEGRESHFLANEARNLKNIIPFGNVWYAKAAIDHLIWQQVLELLSPGYLSSIRSKTAKEYGQDWWWTPGETLPDRAPNLNAAIGD
jgi:hypothetical protein